MKYLLYQLYYYSLSIYIGFDLSPYLFFIEILDKKLLYSSWLVLQVLYNYLSEILLILYRELATYLNHWFLSSTLWAIARYWLIDFRQKMNKDFHQTMKVLVRGVMGSVCYFFDEFGGCLQYLRIHFMWPIILLN